MISRKPQRRESLYIDIHAIRANHLRSFVTSIEARVTGAGPAYGTILAMPVDAIGPTGKFAILAVEDKYCPIPTTQIDTHHKEPLLKFAKTLDNAGTTC